MTGCGRFSGVGDGSGTAVPGSVALCVVPLLVEVTGSNDELAIEDEISELLGAL